MSASAKPELLIEIVTDVMCPWCYIGSQRFKRLLASDEYEEQVGKHVRTIVKVLPYILDSRLPATSFDTPDRVYDEPHTTPFTVRKPPTKDEYYGTKFGAGLDAFDARISKAAAELSLPPLQWRGTSAVGATWDIHRLVVLASTQDAADDEVARGGASDAIASRQMRLMDAAYASFHCDNIDVSDRAATSRLASEVGLFPSADEARKWLDSDEGEYDLRNRLLQTEMNGVRQIPFYIVNDGADHLTGWEGDHGEMLRVLGTQVQNLVR